MKSSITVLLWLGLASPALAATDQELIRDLLAQVAVLTERVSQLESQVSQARPPAEPAAAMAASPAPGVAAQVETLTAARGASAWAEKASLQGDLRGRYEHIEQEGLDDRNRNRIRARLAVTARLQSDLELGFGLSTSQDGDPVSSNQTIGNGGSRKDIFLDLAYFNWTPVQGLALTGGKFRNVLFRPGRHHLLWDGDWNPEGLGVGYQRGLLFANAMATWLDGDSSSGPTELGYGGQAGLKSNMADGVVLTAGLGYFDFGVAGRSTFFGSSTAFGGNSFDPGTNTYIYDYELIQVFAELGFRLWGLPASVFADFVRNTAAGEFDTGWAAGLALGQAKAKGTWELSWTYQDLEADAVLALLTDSDFGGGGTDNKGHVFRGAYALGDRWNIATSWFINDINANQGVKTGYDRVQLDLNFRY